MNGRARAFVVLLVLWQGTSGTLLSCCLAMSDQMRNATTAAPAAVEHHHHHSESAAGPRLQSQDSCCSACAPAETPAIVTAETSSDIRLVGGIVAGVGPSELADQVSAHILGSPPSAALRQHIAVAQRTAAPLRL